MRLRMGMFHGQGLGTLLALLQITRVRLIRALYGLCQWCQRYRVGLAEGILREILGKGFTSGANLL